MRRRKARHPRENEERHRVQIQHNTLSAAAAAVIAFGGLSASVLFFSDASAQQRDILIGGGSVTGVYYQVALQTSSRS